MPIETYRPDQFAPDEVPVNPGDVFEPSGAVVKAFRSEFPTDGQPTVEPVESKVIDNSRNWRVRGDLGDLSGRGEPSNGNKWPSLSRTAVITPVKEAFPRNA